MKILLGTFKNNEGIYLANCLEKLGHTVKVSAITDNEPNMFQKIVKTLILFVQEINGNDAIILETLTFEGIVGLFLSKINRIPLIVYTKGYTPMEDLPLISGIIFGSLRKIILSNCDHIIYISNWTRIKYLDDSKLNKYIVKKPFSIASHSIDPIFFDEKSNDFIDKTKIHLCFASTFYFLEKTKGGLLIIDALSKIVCKYPSANLTIVGDGRYKYLIQERVNELCISDNVTFTGFVDKVSLKRLLQSSYLFIYASFLDGCPTVVMEAQACGIPVIVTNTTGAPELVDCGNTGIVCEPTVNDLVKSIFYLVENPDCYETMKSKCKFHIERNHSWERTANIVNSAILSIH